MREPDLFIANNSQEAAHVALLNELFLHAAANGVADLHFGFDEHGVRVRARVSQRLQPVGQYPRAAGQVFDEKIRSRAKMSISERKRPLSGRLRLRFVAENHFLDVRVEVTQTIDGQKISCRILDQKNSSWSLDELEMSEMVRDSIHQIVDEPNGLFLITGPTGSGKTTTLYAIINKLNVPDLNIITIENPVEYQVKGLTQIQVDDVHMGFPEALRSVLRQDPDVILVGEIRDAETAAIAVQAAITGHLVLTTLHANNSAMAITRLIELGVDPSTLAAALRGVVSQRLVRRLVPRENRRWAPPNDVEVAWMNLHGIVVKNPLFPVVGADDAHDFRGSMPLMEMIVADSAVRKAVPNGSDAIYEAACRQQCIGNTANLFPTLWYKKQGFDAMVGEMDSGGGGVVVETNLSLIVFGRSLDRLERQTAALQSYFSTIGFDMRVDKRVTRELWHMTLPLNTTAKGIENLHRWKTMMSKHAAALAPVFGEWKGSGENHTHLFATRRGQPATFSMWDSQTGYNGIFFGGRHAAASWVARACFGRQGARSTCLPSTRRASMPGVVGSTFSADPSRSSMRTSWWRYSGRSRPTPSGSRSSVRLTSFHRILAS